MLSIGNGAFFTLGSVLFGFVLGVYRLSKKSLIEPIITNSATSADNKNVIKGETEELVCVGLFLNFLEM